MTIRQRIVLLIVLMCLALAAIGGYAVLQTRSSASEVKQVTEGVVPSALASADVVSLVKDIQLATMTLVYAPDANLLAQAQEDLKAKQATLRDALAKQSGSAATRAQKGLLAQADESLTNYFDAIRETAEMKAAGRDEIAQAFLFANVARYRDEMEKIVDTLRIEKNREKDDAIATLNSRLASAAGTIGAVSAAAVVLLSLIGWLLHRQIARPLTRMQSTMSEIAASQDFTRRIEVGRMDEIGHSIVAFNQMIERIQENASLLRQKTTDIQAILQNMQQGILTVVDGGVVHPEYSAYLETIFETRDIAGRRFLDLVFADTALGADALSQVDAAIDACLNQDGINFVFNEHLLPTEIEKHLPDGQVKVLDLSWSAITDDTDTIIRLMLCVRDVTQLRELAAEASEQRRSLEIIGEILAVSEEKFHHFMETAHGFVHENEHIIRQSTEADNAAIAALFRNMHTIKGNARTYKLQHLTDVVHEAEQRLELLRQLESEASEWNPDALLHDVARVRDTLAHYTTISEDKLGRKGKARRTAGLTATPLADAEIGRIRESLRLLEGARTDSLAELLSMRAAVHRILRVLDATSIAEVLSPVVDALPSLAAELGKAAPQVSIQDNGYRLRAEVTGMLENVFTHLLRNAIDHGIEPVDARLAAGKPAAGNIHIEAGVDQQLLQITVDDDGRGLALHKIRATAIERGWIHADAATSDDAIAQFIFHPGFSTAATVTTISGRGVGMDAVREFLSRSGGSIELRFTDNHVGAPFRQFQTVVSLPEHYAVDSVAVLAETPAPMAH
ncbi:MCP four helix bundle domain-containing protein [Cupriavidus pauculus]|uniref:MCP four helix bundle domain-containing protein n=1 Tax=Cupriavidus pauculus TaxID=82633 RepID=UPI001EE20DA4|nr:MCP four helix bundle domain-containing protein [Cupriavidus pauculus]GJG96277.1 HAMP domain-containing protein [Cupriavidus pauculus]